MHEFFENEPKAPKHPTLVAQDNKIANFKNAFNAVCKTDNGLAVFRFICEYLQFKDSTLSYSADGAVDTKRMLHNEAQRRVWVELRKHLDPNVRNTVERSE